LNNKYSSRIVLQYFLALVIFIAVTADRNMFILHFIHDKANILITSLFVLTVFFLYLSENIIQGYIKFKSHKKSIIVVLILISIYFFIHNIVIPTSIIPIKYSMLSLLIVLFLIKKINISPIINGFAVIGLFLSIAIILQQVLLILFHLGDLSEFSILLQKAGREGRAPGYVAPYGLGFIEASYFPFTTIGGVEYYRPALFSHEPKHAASVLLLTLSTVFLSKYSSVSKKIMIGIHLTAILLVMAFTAFTILIVSSLMYFIYKKDLFSKYYIHAVLTIPFILPWLLETFLSLFISGNNLLQIRLLSAYETIGKIERLSMPSLFGFGSNGALVKLHKDSMLYYIHGQYGIIGLILVALLLYYLNKYIIKQFSLKQFTPSDNFASIMLINIFIFYNLYALNDILNLFSTAIIIMVLYICDVKKFIIINNKWRFN